MSSRVTTIRSSSAPPMMIEMKSTLKVSLISHLLSIFPFPSLTYLWFPDLSLKFHLKFCCSTHNTCYFLDFFFFKILFLTFFVWEWYLMEFRFLEIFWVHWVSTLSEGNHREDFRWKRLSGNNGHRQWQIIVVSFNFFLSIFKHTIHIHTCAEPFSLNCWFKLSGSPTDNRKDCCGYKSSHLFDARSG